MLGALRGHNCPNIACGVFGDHTLPTLPACGPTLLWLCLWQYMMLCLREATLVRAGLRCIGRSRLRQCCGVHSSCGCGRCAPRLQASAVHDGPVGMGCYGCVLQGVAKCGCRCQGCCRWARCLLQAAALRICGSGWCSGQERRAG